MTTTEVPIRRTIQCIIKGVTVKMSTNGNEYLDIEVLHNGLKYPNIYKCWEPEELEHLAHHVNEEWAIILERGRLKDGKENNNDPKNYWWDAVGEDDTSAPEAPPPDHSEPVTEVQRPVPTPSRSDPTRDSIERQVALKEANAATQFLILHQEAFRNAVLGDPTEQMFKPEDINTNTYLAVVEKLSRGMVTILQGSSHA